MTTDQWMTLGIWISGAVFTVVGFFIVRELRRNDQTIKDLWSEINRLRHEVNRCSTAQKVMQMLLEQKRIIPSTVKFPSPNADGAEETA